MTQKEAEDTLIQFIITKKEEGMSSSALNNYVAAVAKFYLINDKPINISRVNRFMPEPLKVKKDRGYQPEEILKVLELANERTRALILLLASTGVRLGSISDLTMDDLEDKADNYKVTVYKNTRQEYITYTTPEAKKALETYFDVRRRDGEVINEKSPVIRERSNRQSLLSIEYPRHTTKASIIPNFRRYHRKGRSEDYTTQRRSGRICNVQKGCYAGAWVPQILYYPVNQF